MKEWMKDRIERKKRTKNERLLSVYKKKGSKKNDGLTDLPIDLLKMITDNLKKVDVTDDVLDRTYQGKKKKKKTKKRKKRKKRN